MHPAEQVSNQDVSRQSCGIRRRITSYGAVQQKCTPYS